MDETEGFCYDETEVYIVGLYSPQNIDIDENTDMFLNTEKYEVLRGFNELNITYPMTFRSYARYLGYSVQLVEDEEDVDLDLISNMPCYPIEGYCKMIDGKMIVKFD